MSANMSALINLIPRLTTAILGVVALYVVWTGYISAAGDEVLNNYQQAQALERTINNHDRDKLVTDIAIAEITISIYEAAIIRDSNGGDGADISPRETRNYEDALRRKGRWEEDLEIIEGHLRRLMAGGGGGGEGNREGDEAW